VEIRRHVIKTETEMSDIELKENNIILHWNKVTQIITSFRFSVVEHHSNNLVAKHVYSHRRIDE
jgi:hypothetical protein